MQGKNHYPLFDTRKMKWDTTNCLSKAQIELVEGIILKLNHLLFLSRIYFLKDNSNQKNIHNGYRFRIRTVYGIKAMRKARSLIHIWKTAVNSLTNCCYIPDRAQAWISPQHRQSCLGAPVPRVIQLDSHSAPGAKEVCSRISLESCWGLWLLSSLGDSRVPSNEAAAASHTHRDTGKPEWALSPLENWKTDDRH